MQIRTRSLVVCLALALAALAPTAAVAQPQAPSLGLVAPAADAQLEPIALGFERWLRNQLTAAGIATLPLGDTREAAFAAAHAQGQSRVLAPRLALRDGQVDVQLALYVPESGALIAGARAQATLAEVGVACAGALDRLLEQLGVARGEPSAPPLLDDLASTSRAMRAWQADDWIGAWHEVQGRLTPTAMGLREEIVELSRGGEGPPLQRARVLAAAGDPSEAARLIGYDAAQALRAEQPDPHLLVAGGELALARGDAAIARASFERALTLDAGDTTAALGLARALQEQGLAAESRSALERAANLRGTDAAPLALLATQVEERDPTAAAASWLEAGRRSARQLEVQRARMHFERAIALDPTLAGEASLAVGSLEERLGRPAEALAAYRQAAGADPPGPVLLVSTGRMQRALGQKEPARSSLAAALSISDQDPAALSELGALELESGDGAKAVELLRTARSQSPNDAEIRHRYALALQKTGQNEQAMGLLEAPDASAAELRLAAEIQGTRGDLPAARASLARAVTLEPLDSQLRSEHARVLEQLGAKEDAAAERSLVALLDGRSAAGGEAGASSHLGALSLDELVTSFAAQLPRSSTRRVASLGIREPTDLRSRLWRLVRPRGPDLRAIEQALQLAIDARFANDAGRPEIGEELGIHIDRLFEFEDAGSLDAQTIAAVDQVLGVDGVFVGRLVSQAADDAHRCGADDLALELRLLSGRDPELVSALANQDCVRGGALTYAAWNYLAFALYAIAALALGWPLIRGWGGIQVDIKLPERTRGFFSIHITRRADAVKKERISKKTGRKQMKSGKLDFLKRFERHMAGRQTLFRMIPARKQPYTVTVAGPLMDARGDEIIGHFMEEQRATVTRRLLTKLEFDFCPRECAVEVRILKDGRPAPGGRVAVEGDPSSLRYAREGVAYLYLGAGRYTILIGCKDAATSLPLEIQGVTNAIPLSVDFEHSEGIVFRNCPQAVDAYLQSDLASAAIALETNGQAEAAHLLRAALYRRQGKHQEAAREFEAAGQLEDAAAMRASGSDYGGSAELYEQAGDFTSAAQAHRSAGALEKAAECYERAYDYARAIECWREIGDREREGLLLEKLGEYVEAAGIARELGDAERALSLLAQVDTRNVMHPQACRLVAEIASERGDHDLAVSKLEEALGDTGMEHASVDMIEAYAGALDRASRGPQALSAYEVLRRRDASRTDVVTHIQRLRSAVETEATSQRPTRASAPAESRYELLGELGRGGMGVVYKARDRRLGRVVALKRLPESMKHHPQAVALFEREARAAAALNHRNIVTIFDAGEEDGNYFISMELLEGRPISGILAKQRRLRAGDVLKLGGQICTGLHFAHERRIVHRDIKSANLFFTNERVVKIMDFGIAKSLEEVRRQATVIGGTPYYMAPEQAAGQQVDHRADLYALGVTLFQLATGELPFPDGDVSYRHRHEAPPDPRELEADVPAALAKLILALMAKQPGDRPADAGVVGEAMRSLLAAL